MRIFKNLLSSIFSSKREEVIQAKEKTNYLDKWEKERLKRIANAETQIKEWTVNFIKEKGGINFSWESGSDEAFVEIHEFEGQDKEKLEILEYYLIDVLEIPDAGEFAMEGKGQLYIVHNSVMAKYESIMKSIVDYNEETDEEIYDEIVEDSGERALFKIE